MVWWRNFELGHQHHRIVDIDGAFGLAIKCGATLTYLSNLQINLGNLPNG